MEVCESSAISISLQKGTNGPPFSKCTKTQQMNLAAVVINSGYAGVLSYPHANRFLSDLYSSGKLLTHVRGVSRAATFVYFVFPPSRDPAISTSGNYAWHTIGIASV